MPIERYCTEIRDGKQCQGAEDCPWHAGGKCVFEYVASEYAPEHRWLGEEPPPSRWRSGNTVVYRSYADFCD